MHLLLLSNGSLPDQTYLEYARGWIQNHFSASPQKPRRLLFIPYAKHDSDAYLKLASEALAPLGLELLSVHSHPSPASLIDQVDGVFIPGGNTFRLLDRLRKTGLFAPIRDRVKAGLPYLGVSAGTNIAAPTIMTTNDMPVAWPETPKAFGFVPFQINAHYVSGKFYYEEDGKKFPHNGETRDQRIAEYHEENQTPVIALHEGTGLSITGKTIECLGNKPARIFIKGQESSDADSKKLASFRL